MVMITMPHLCVCSPLELQAQQRDLRRVAEDEVLEAHLVHVAVCALDDGLHRCLHAVHQPLQPPLHHACTRKGSLNFQFIPLLSVLFYTAFASIVCVILKLHPEPRVEQKRSNEGQNKNVRGVAAGCLDGFGSDQAVCGGTTEQTENV